MLLLIPLLQLSPLLLLLRRRRRHAHLYLRLLRLALPQQGVLLQLSLQQRPVASQPAPVLLLPLLHAGPAQESPAQVSLALL